MPNKAPTHRPHRLTREIKQHSPERSTRAYDRTWQRFRIMILRERPLCQDCTSAASAEVHHIVKVRDNPALRLTECNVMALCKRCHSTRTARGE